MFFTGLRPEEAIAVRWSDVDLRTETIRIQRVRTFKGSERKGTKTNESAMSISCRRPSKR